ncbi:hypothetical protein [Rossellomorea vietnamensis]|uniref:Uncharacterized protein n=1 Tax=Rossellomorea vietnamensis TaxID=218284 RepID=A0A0P6WDP0_9BACI|nr:hypothetical protein [Rossellomorea vietnamensis]KPL58332.1 hypothetical protein AM506_17065 [Rossellomorea vietnamensis]
MDKQIINMLSDIQQNIKELDSNVKDLDSNMKEFDHKLKEFGNDLKEVKETVNRIETSQTEDVISLLKVGNQRSETDFQYLNTRITDIDKRVFTLENRPER